MVKTQPPELKKFMDKKLSGKLCGLTSSKEQLQDFSDRRLKVPKN